MTNFPQLSVPESTSEFVLELPRVRTTCLNEFPAYANTTKKIAIVGDCPYGDDIEYGKLFSGRVGNLIFNSILKYGINRADCFLGATSSTPLPTKFIKPWSERDFTDGVTLLKTHIKTHKPNIVLLAGQWAIEAAFPNEQKKITDWRGSILSGASTGICPSIKCIPCLHPWKICRQWDQWPLFIHDLERFAVESNDPSIIYTPRLFDLDVSAARACELLANISNITTPIALDIEGGVAGISCISFARSPTEAFIVPLAAYSNADKVRVLRALYNFLSSTTPKILQNQLYDNFVLSWSYRTPICNVVWDTMLSGWEIYPELPKGLGTQVSIWTREPFYKMDRKSESTTTLHQYCCKDSACTYEIYEKHKQLLEGRPNSIRHFRFNMSLLPALLYLEQRGMNYDFASSRLALTDVSSEMLRYQTLIDKQIRDNWIAWGSRGDPLKPVNIGSPKQLMDVLYRRLGLKTMYKKKKRGDEGPLKETSDEDALLKLYQETQNEGLLYILQWRKNEKLRQTIEAKLDKDGRARCSYNLVGTETGRLSCYKSPTGAGGNFTTITKRLRHLYCADPDHWFWQCDLRGADGWTVAAHAALHGDSTMLDDYLYGLKPAKIIVLMLRHGAEVNKWTRERLKEESKSVTEDGPDGHHYFTGKQIQHGSCYGMKADKVCERILIKSYKETGTPIVVKKYEAQRLLDLFFLRYRGVPFWQQWIKRELNERSTLTCASGHVRKFFGRRFSDETYGEGYAHEPQANTTYATNLALWRLWTDKENRLSNSSRLLLANSSRPETSASNGLDISSMVTRLRKFRIEPLHHVHDALCGQFHKSDLDWAKLRLRDYFDNPLIIAGRRIVIPFEGQYGPSWGQLGEKYGGGNI